MALDIGLELTEGGTDPLDRSQVVSLEAGEMAFLYEPFQAFQNQTGLVILPFEDTRVTGEYLKIFERLLLETMRVVESSPNQWEEFTELQYHPQEVEIYTTLFRSELQQKLNGLVELTRAAIAAQRVLFFYGD
ncbi:hypothetical protein Enr10x_26500 [Gimesia panareensis]|uniref:Uncharacterized protein n=1 Tax=Gimesia panareensis TaxID=2527978 RepID=A0A517Q6U9_9PLAN|nr:hypothetical protein [Gimesia panareensis]QDT27333.1 hypothetical protein Enr10x_26500 [Gimesia panareensis]